MLVSTLRFDVYGAANAKQSKYAATVSFRLLLLFKNDNKRNYG